MAEIVGTTAAIGSILKAVVSAGTLIQSISQAPQEARQVADQIEATKAVLKSLQASLKTVNRPPEFLRIWNGSTRVILGNIRTTIEELNGRLGGQGTTPPRIVKLTFWRRVAWPLDREEGLRLQLQLQTYLQLLAITQNALMKYVLDVLGNGVSDPIAGAPRKMPKAQRMKLKTPSPILGPSQYCRQILISDQVHQAASGLGAIATCWQMILPRKLALRLAQSLQNPLPIISKSPFQHQFQHPFPNLLQNLQRRNHSERCVAKSSLSTYP